MNYLSSSNHLSGAPLHSAVRVVFQQSSRLKRRRCRFLCGRGGARDGDDVTRRIHGAVTEAVSGTLCGCGCRHSGKYRWPDCCPDCSNSNTDWEGNRLQLSGFIAEMITALYCTVCGWWWGGWRW